MKNPVRILATTLVVGLVFLTSCVTAQDCVLVKNEKDKFTGHRVVQTGYNTLHRGTVGGIRLRTTIIDSVTILNLAYSLPRAYSVDEGKELMLLLSDGSKVTLKNLEYRLSEAATGAGVTIFAAMLDFPLSPDEIKRLSQNDVTAVRLYTNDGYFDDDIKPKFAASLRKSILCAQSSK